jgi:hypothetical protein
MHAVPRASFTSKNAIEQKLYGPDVVNDQVLQELENSPVRKHPKDPAEKMERILNYMEQIQKNSRDNNAILYQLITSMEERINKRIENVRLEMVDLINAKGSSPTSAASSDSTQNLHAFSSKVSFSETKEKYSAGKPSGSGKPMPATEAFYDMVDIQPQPGFVIKTRKLIGEKNKVFINVFHHDLIALTPPGLAPEQATDKPYLMMEAPSTTVDHAGISCMTFNVGISSEFFTMPNPKVDISITAPATVYKVSVLSLTSCVSLSVLHCRDCVLSDHSQDQPAVQ